MRSFSLLLLLCLLSVTAEARDFLFDGAVKVSCPPAAEPGCAALEAFLKKSAAGETVTARTEKELTAPEKKRLADIRALYDKLAKKSKASDVSAEIMAAGLCAELGLTAGATQYLDRAEEKRPKDSTFLAFSAKMKKLLNDCGKSDACPIF
jgi:hypothetical protein